ncbi:peptidoglycan-binding domain-containing protein [Streptomyces prunicolor]|uniref:Peptidoglycan-binding domain-containing protein n=1 Tax=Streptomyces prunicolor TaxID=67348 RepID=A0ABU4F7P6_9ACTN|nr:peptidoglycan-binding domain-containing protein [Streptomyces prunicolor]MDV7216616.1 peptidoglycan-binding domain-containing protein [Streptomyces prunicolor]
MNEAKGHICPQCGAPRAADGSPSCACTQRASDALRDARTAEAAAAEDFDPLRIRPYVELDGTPQEQTPPATPVAPEGETQRLPAIEETMLLRAVTASPPPAQETSVLPTLRTPSDTAPIQTDLSLFADGGSGKGSGAAPDPLTDDEDPPRRRHRRTVLLAAAGAVVAVTAVAAFASGMFSYETPSRDEAAPQDVRASVPTASKSPASATPSTSGSTSAQPTSASPAPSLSGTPSPTASSSPSATASRSAPASHTPTPTASTSTSSATGRQSNSTPTTVLQRGDEGPEVTELQLRLTEAKFYSGPDNGIFDKQVQTSVRAYQVARGITSDELGVYGTATRARLESETPEP